MDYVEAFFGPEDASDERFVTWYRRYARMASSPGTWAAMQRMLLEVDVRDVLGVIRVPTLVVHRKDDRWIRVGHGRFLAEHISGAKYVELDGTEHHFFQGNSTQLLDVITQFISGRRHLRSQDVRVLATVLFTDIVSSTEQLAARGDDAWRQILDDHDQMTALVVAEYRGRVIKQLGDGILATFDGPARAVRCAAALRDAATQQGLTLRAGLHTGEIELRDTDVTGIAVVVAQRISTHADPNEILASRTVVDLTAGSGLGFEPRGEHHLKGVPGVWPTFAAQTRTGTPAP